MSQSSNNKALNTSTLYESIQLKNVTLHVSNLLTEDDSTENVKNLNLLNHIYISAPTKLKSVFGNNLANSKIGEILVSLLNSYNSDDILSVTKKLCLNLCLSCLWNATDCSENMGAALVNMKEFREAISVSFKKCYSATNADKELAYSIISIIHNIIRRPKLVDSFKGYDLEVEVVMLATSCDEISIKMISLVVFLEIQTKIQLKEFLHLYKSIEETVVCFLDGASNSEDYRSEGFSGKELLEIVKSLSRIDNLKYYFANSNTLRATFIRFLSQNFQIPLVIDVIKTIYDENDIQSLLDIYKSKNKEYNQQVLDGLLKTNN